LNDDEKAGGNAGFFVVANKYRRRPGERRDPYAAAARKGAVADTFFTNKRRWLWVPAFAGTTD
jgi:hypothetical protein